MTILVAGGDSFVWGTELADVTFANWSKNTYSALLAQNAGLEYVCAARPGNSNDAIARMTIAECERQNLLGEKILVIVSWTFITRYEFLFNYAINSPISPWASINLWGGDKPAVAEFSKMFFKHVGSNTTHQQYNSLQATILLQTYLKQKNIPYLFTMSDNNSCSRYMEIVDSNVESLRNLIDWDNWYFFPPGNTIHETTDPRGFYQWAAEEKYDIGPRLHPLEEAHANAYLLLKEKFNEMVNKSI